MKRDFTEAGLQKLLTYIENATSHTTLEKIVDVFGDIGSNIAGFFGFFNIARYTDDMDTYHKKILDAKNTTEAQIREIFRSARSIDTDYGASLQDEAAYIDTITNLVTELTNTIDPSGGNLNMSERASVLDAAVSAMSRSRATKDANIEKNCIGTDPDAAAKSLDPVNLSSGNFIYDRSDIAVESELGPEFHRYYNSLSHKLGTVGVGFSHSYELSVIKNKTRYTITMPDGMHIRFEENDGRFEPVDDMTWRFERAGDNYRLISADGIINILDKDFRLMRREDRNGVGVSLSYEEDGKLVRVQNDYEDFIQLSYNEEHLIREVTDNTGRKVSYSYQMGRMTEAVLWDGAVISYSYDNSDGIKELKTGGRSLIKNEYDNRYRVTRQRFADGSFMSFLYDDVEQTVTQVERNGVKTVYVHDDEYRNTEIRYEDGTTEKFVYNDKSQCIKYTDRHGHVVRMAYDNQGNLVQKVDPIRRRWNFTYNAAGQLLSLSVNGKNVRKNHYDNKGNLLYTESNLSRSAVREYDENGNVVRLHHEDGAIDRYDYDAKGNLVCVTRASGAVYRYEYNERRQVVSVTDPNGYRSQFAYDEGGRLTKEINALGDAHEYIFRKDGLLQADIDYDGTKRERNYNAVNLLSEYMLTPDNTVRYSYDSMWNLTKQEFAGNAAIRNEYDRENRLIRRIGADGIVTEYEYAADGEITAVITGGARTEYRHDPAGRVISVINPLGGEVSYQYDEFDNIIHIEDSIGNTADLLYDSDMRLAAEEDNFGEKRYFEYDAAGRIAKITNEFGTSVRYLYVPGENRYREIQYDDGTSQRFDYDGNGNLIQYYDRAGNEVVITYDAVDRPISYLTNGVFQKSFIYDKRGNILETKDGAGRHFRYSYNLLDQLTEVINPDGTKAVYTYDPNGRMLKNEVFAADGERIGCNCYDRDENGQVVKITDISGIEEFFAYADDGVMTKHIDKEGYTTLYSHNPLGQINKIEFDDGRCAVMTHNSFGHLERVEDWIGRTEIQNDGLGRALNVTYPDGKSIAYSYNSNGRRTKIRYSAGDEITYSYDKLQRLTEINAAGEIYSYLYGDNGRLQKTLQPGGIETEYGYNSLGYVNQITSRDRNSILDSIGITYDAYGRKQSLTRNMRGCPETNGLFEYKYDTVGRLTDVLRDGDPYHSYTFDAFGNITSCRDENGITSFGYNQLNQLISRKNSEEENSYQYDRRGNLIGITSDGKMERQYSYGAMNTLDRTSCADGSSAAYLFNGLGYRVGEERNFADTAGEKVSYVVDMTQIYDNLLEQHSDGNDAVYFWDPYRVIGMNRNDNRSSFAHDEMGSVIRTVDTDGAVTGTSIFDEYGRTIGQDGAVGSSPFGFINYYRDDLAGAYFVQARDYMPEILRFTARDYYHGMDDHILSQNNYILCWDDPENYEDRDGRFVLAAMGIAAGIGAVSGAAISAVTQGIAIAQGKQEKFDVGKMVGSAVEGAVVGGVGALFPATGAMAAVGAVASGAAGAAAGNAIEQGINKGFKNIDGMEVLENGIVGGIVSGVTFGISKGVDKLIGKEATAATKDLGRQKEQEVKAYASKVKVKDNSADRRGINKMAEKLTRLKGEESGLLKKFTKEEIKKTLVGKGTVLSIAKGDGAVGKTIYSVLGLKAGKSLFKEFLQNAIPLHDNGKDAVEEAENYISTQAGKIAGQCPIYAAA